MQFTNAIENSGSELDYLMPRKELFEFQLDWTDEEVLQPLDIATNTNTNDNENNDDYGNDGNNWTCPISFENNSVTDIVNRLEILKICELPKLREFTEADNRAAEVYHREAMVAANHQKHRCEQERIAQRKRQLAETIEID